MRCERCEEQQWEDLEIYATTWNHFKLIEYGFNLLIIFLSKDITL